MALESRKQNSIFKCQNYAKEKVPVFNSQGTHRRPLRIADVLKQPEDCALNPSMEPEDRAAVYCTSPRRIMSRWISGLKKRKPKTDSAGPKKEEDGHHRETDGDCNAAGLGEIAAPELDSSAVVKSGSVRKSHSFTLGVGCCLLYLVAAGRSELSKIVEMKVQMAELLRNVKEDLQLKNSSCSYTTSHVETLHCSDLCSSSRVLPELPSTSTSSCPLITTEMKSKDDVDELEADLERELARLHIHLEEDTFSVAELNGRDEEKATSKSRRWWENGSDYNEESGGVCPYVLERKLQNILNERQEEHIRELEAELACVKRKLVEKEMEISLWKDTAKMIANATPESLLLADSPSNLTPCISFNLR